MAAISEFVLLPAAAYLDEQGSEDAGGQATAQKQREIDGIGLLEAYRHDAHEEQKDAGGDGREHQAGSQAHIFGADPRTPTRAPMRPRAEPRIAPPSRPRGHSTRHVSAA